MKTTFFKIGLVLLTCGVLGVTASADQPYKPDLVQGGNLWTVTAYDDDSPTHKQVLIGGVVNSALICFQYEPTPSAAGTQQRYLWQSLTFKGSAGKARQEGDQVFMHGDFPVIYPDGKIVPDFGHDSIQWEIAINPWSDSLPAGINYQPDAGIGHWIVWLETGDYGQSLAFANVKFQRSGYCKFLSTNESAALPVFKAE